MPNKNYHVAFLFAYVLIVCKAMEACYRIIGFSYIYASALFLSGVILYAVYRRLNSKVPVKAVYLLVIAAVISIIAFFYRHELYELLDIYILPNFESINEGIYTASAIYFHQFLPFLIFLLPITAFICMVFSMKGHAELSILTMSLYMFSFWNNGLDWLIARYVPFFILLSIIYLSISRYDNLIKALKRTDCKISVVFRRIMLYTLISASLVTLFSAAATHVFGTKSVVQLKNDYEYRESRLEDTSKKAAFQLYSHSFGLKSGRLGGPISLNSLIAFKVRADRPEYLRGTVKDYYDGTSWNKSFDGYTIKPAGTLMKPDQDFSMRMTGSTGRRPDARKLSVYPSGLSTSTLFTPGNAFNINARSGKVIYDFYNTYMLLGKERVNDSYTISYYTSNTGIERFNPRDDRDHSFSYDAGSNALVKERYSLYLQVPESITPRTYALVERIIRDCRTTQEKASAIMRYLSDNYSYSLNVSQVPDNHDFVDYFLFREKKGYCTYFATASAIMFRIAGIPSRYVEGFNMDNEQESPGLYIVRNHRAHAWAEILTAHESNLWSIADCVPQGASIEEINSSGLYRDRFDGWYENDNSILANDQQSGYNDLSNPDYSFLLGILLYPMVFIPALAFLLSTAYVTYKLVLFNITVRRHISSRSMIPLYLHLSERLAMGEDFPEECCELEYARSIKDRELAVHMEGIIKACYEEHYGGIANDTAIDKKSINRLVEKYLRKKQGFFKYWYYRIRYMKKKERKINEQNV